MVADGVFLEQGDGLVFRALAKSALADASIFPMRTLTTAIRRRNWQLCLEDEAAAAVRMRAMPVSLHLQTTEKCNFRG